MKSYGQYAAEAIQALTSDPDLTEALSAPAQVTGYALYEAVSGNLGKDLTASVAGSVPADVADEVTAGAMQIVKFVMTAVAQGDVGLAAVELAQAALNFIPIFGTLANIAIDLAQAADNTMSGIGPASGDKNVRIAFCQAQFSAPNGSGPGKQVMPADIFAEGASTNGYGESVMSSFGVALQYMGEPDSADFGGKGMSITAVRARADLFDFLGENNPLAWSRVPTLGVPKKTQALLKSLRLAIAGMRGQKTTDGGASLMIIYVDILRILWERGNMGGYYFNAIMDNVAFPIHPDVRTRGETCYTHEKRGEQAALNLIEGWNQTLQPYAQFAKPEELSEAQGEILGRVQGMLDRNNRVALLASALRHRPRLGPIDLSDPGRKLGPISF